MPNVFEPPVIIVESDVGRYTLDGHEQRTYAKNRRVLLRDRSDAKVGETINYRFERDNRVTTIKGVVKEHVTRFGRTYAVVAVDSP